jgi:prephenate dehydratase
MVIGIMGAKGSFSEEAARTYMSKEGLSAELDYLVSAERVLTALEEGNIDIGIFPIENSNGGIVIEAVYAMARHRFTVEKLFEIDVHQNLLVLPGTNAEQITEITSHDQALKQCRMYLKRKWPGVEITEYVDTAKAAEDLANGTLLPTTAVIASKAAAPLYGLDILEESIQDLKFNYTSFVVAKKYI